MGIDGSGNVWRRVLDWEGGVDGPEVWMDN